MEGIRAGPDIDAGDRTEAAERKPERSGAGAPPPLTLSPQQGAEAIVESGINRQAMRVDVLFLKGFWGGIFLSYGGLFEAVVGGSPWEMTNNPGILRLLEGLVFPVGLTQIVLSGTDLLTSDMMFTFVAALKGGIPWWGVAYICFVVFWGNLAGSLFFAAILTRYTDLATGPVKDFLVTTAQTRSHVAWHSLFLRGIGCNIAVCMAVFLASLASDMSGKILGIFLALGTFVALQFEHVVADMFTIPMGMMLGANVSVGRYVGHTMMPALIGNFVGAWMLGGSFYWMYLTDTSTPFFRLHRKRIDPERNGHGHDSLKSGPLGPHSFGHGTKIQHHIHAPH